MYKNIAASALVVFFAFAILTVSIFRSAAVKYDFSGEQPSQVLGEDSISIDYVLAYPGSILPDHPLWPVKAVRDRLWFLSTTNHSRKAELLLLFSDKRLASSKILFERGDPGLGYSVMLKSEDYLEKASRKEESNRKEHNLDTTEFLLRLSNASLKHIETMEEIKAIAPEDAIPKIEQTQKIAEGVYERAVHGLNEKGIESPKNPFNKD